MYNSFTVFIFTDYAVFLVHGSLIVQLPVWGPMTGRTLPPSLNSRNISHLMRRDNNKNGQDDKKLFFSVLIFQGAEVRGTGTAALNRKHNTHNSHCTWHYTPRSNANLNKILKKIKPPPPKDHRLPMRLYCQFLGMGFHFYLHVDEFHA